MKLVNLIIKIIGGGLTLYFIVSEIIYLLSFSDNNLSEIFSGNSLLFIIIVLKSTLIFLALPFLYFFKILDFFDISFPGQGGMMSSEFGLMQTKIFYKAVYVVIFVLIILSIIEKIHI